MTSFLQQQRFSYRNYISDMSQAAEDYSSSLCDLTVNSRPLISLLTMLAEDYINAAPSIVAVVEDHIKQVQGEKLPTLYLIDSIVKNVGKDYVQLFSNNLPQIFSSVFQKSDEKVRMLMFKLRHTWNEVFHASKLYSLDLLVHNIDKKWPVTPVATSTRVHVNPLFMKSIATTADRPSSITSDGMMREKILKEKKELLELEKRKVELQLLQTQEVLEQKQRKLESYATNIKADIPMKRSSKIETPSILQGDEKHIKPNSQASLSKDSVSDNNKKPEDIPPGLTDKKSDLIISRDPRVKKRQRILEEQSASSSNVESKKSKLDKTKRSRDVSDDACSEFNASSKKSKTQSEFNKDSNNKKNTSPVKIPIKSSKSSTSIEKDVLTETDTSEDYPERMFSHTNSSTMNKSSNKLVDENKGELTVVSGTDTEINQPPVFKSSDEDSNSNDTSSSRVSKSSRKVIENLDENSGSVQKEQEILHEEEKGVSPNFGTRSKSPATVSSPSHSNNSPSSSPNVTEPTVSLQPDLSSPFNIPPESSSAPSPLTVLKTSEESGKDTDLRLLLNPVKRITSEPSDDENKADDGKKVKIMKLFGEEDVDLRKVVPAEITTLPSPPPPPFLGDRSSDQPDHGKSWAQLKSSDRRDKQSVKYPRNKPDRLGRSPNNYSPYTSEQQEMESTSSADRARSSFKLIIKEAEERFRKGDINFVQYNEMLNDVLNMNEERKIHEVKHYYPMNYPREEQPALFPEAPGSVPQMDVTHYHVSKPQYRHPFLPPHHHMDMDSGYKPRRQYENVGYYDWFDRGPRTNMVERGGGRPPFCRPVTPCNNIGRPAPPVRNPAFPMYYNQPRRMIMRPPNCYRPPRMDRPVISHRPPLGGPRTHIPLVDRNLLAEAEKDVTDGLPMGDMVRQIRFYGDIGILMMSKDDPREVGFQPGARHLIIDQQHKFLLKFGVPPVEIILDGFSSFVRLGVPTRELYVDDMYYAIIFGERPVDIIICGRTRLVMLEGPPPIVRYGQVKRLDLVAGKVNLIVDAKSVFPIFLDGRPQKFEIAGEPCVLKFADALQTVLLNGAPVHIEFGGSPVPIIFKGREHFIRLTLLPKDVIPGRVNIKDMEVFSKYPLPPLPPPPMPPPIQVHQQSYSNPIMGPECMPGPNAPQPVDMLPNVIMHQPYVPSPSGSPYFIEPQPEPGPASAPPPLTPAATAITNPDNKNINLGELLKKLEFIGLVPSKSSTAVPDSKNTTFLANVDFSRPETLKVRQPGLIAQLYSGSQCSSCGIRFPPEGTKMYSRHLDWHFRQNRKEKASTKIPHSRNWYYDLSDIIQYQEVEDIDDNIDPHELIDDDDMRKENSPDELFEEPPSVPIGELKNAKCKVCCDKFEEFYNHEKDEWHIKNAIVIDDSVFHPICYEEFKVRKESPVEEVPIAVEENISVNEDKPEAVEVIELDDTIETQHPSQKSDDSTLTSSETSKNLNASNDDIQVDLTGDEDGNESENEPPGNAILLHSPEAEASEPPVEDDNQLVKQEIESDDDILHIEVIERKIESYELLDDEDDGKGSKEPTPVKEPPPKKSETAAVVIGSDDETEFDFSNVVIKQEKDKFPETVVDSALPTYTATIDGNIIHEKANPIVVPGKIKINITRGVKSSSEGTDSPTSSCSSTSETVVPPQPPPPGEENVITMKPSFEGIELIENPSVTKGNELSGLCSIM